MLRFTSGQAFANCSGFRRRSFLCAGASGIAGLTLPDVLAADAQSSSSSSRKSVIIIHLDGGPPQMDLIDPKPDAPSELRSPFAPIGTKVPGVGLTELMPRCAGIADQLVFLRSLVGADGKHHAFQCQSGYKETVLQSIGGRPALGCVVNHLLGSPEDQVPNFVDLMQGRPLVRNSARPGFLGPSVKPFRPDISDRFSRELEEGMKGELARLGDGHKTELKLIKELPVDRIDDRLALLKRLDQFNRALDDSGEMEAMDHFTRQAYTILTSGSFAGAMDLDQEDPRVIEHYTPKLPAGGTQSYTSEGPEAALKFLLARRLVEAGVRVVSISLSDFDTHSDNNDRMKQLGPLFDFGFHALVTDLQSRGMLDDVTVLAWGEFGRTPKINAKGGRDHWPRLSMGMMAGGGMPGGVVLGQTDKVAGEATDRPVDYTDIVATLYHQLGIDPGRMIHDRSGRPHVLMDHGEVIRELI
ncbi:DUF1501 domain-containing protein [Stieleria sp. ICT_E10.1]|uniref:DUF1501 domain-containing protein n=1 Tax=Stieleria sedimenti TaxID=2976331 RepID=UPI00217FBF52|nr:DUF1501 domain-containing protein [Stieleria sedimenti]MCS7467851.1 DUF1501 domain-containing protein [Stieleria sedimenti]